MYVGKEGRDIFEVVSDEVDVCVVKGWRRVWFVVRMSEGVCE